MALKLPERDAVPEESAAISERPTDEAPSRLRVIWSQSDILVPAGIFVFIVAACFLWPLVYPLRSPEIGQFQFANLPPLSPHYILGTDPIGDDILSRILYGGRISLEVGFGSNFLGLLVGGALGTIAGYRGGVVDSIIMRTQDILLAFPSIILALVLVSYLGPSELNVIWAIAFFAIPAYARLSRATTLRVREYTFIAASKLSGASDLRILGRHIVPNVVPPMLTFGCLGVAVAIIVEAALSFLGLGVPPPAPSWGNMIAQGESFLATNPYLIVVPSCFLFVTVLSLNLLGDALRKRLADR
jgi:peptide/nickel transport system permease protein